MIIGYKYYYPAHVLKKISPRNWMICSDQGNFLNPECMTPAEIKKMLNDDEIIFAPNKEIFEEFLKFYRLPSIDLIKFFELDYLALFSQTHGIPLDIYNAEKLVNENLEFIRRFLKKRWDKAVTITPRLFGPPIIEPKKK